MADPLATALISQEEKRKLAAFYWRRKAIEEGDFLLASGKRSRYYIDSRLVTTHPPGGPPLPGMRLTIVVSEILCNFFRLGNFLRRFALPRF